MPQHATNKPFYVTTPIYYVNDRPHIGHVYTTTVADVVARYHRLRGEDTFFLTGTDEHAAKVVDAAAERGLTAQQWADRNADEFESTFRRLGLTHDDFIRTSQPRHTQRVQQYVKQLLDSGDVYLGDYEGWYDAGQEEYVPENKAKDYDFKSPINGKPLVKKKEQNYFFKLSAYADDLLKLLDGGEVAGQTFDVQPVARKNEVAARIREGLNDVPISRHAVDDAAAKWGISVPGDEKHTIYVWIDALFNYLSTIDVDDPDDRRKYWPADVHLIAKDILWFHAVIWPALLLALRRQQGSEWIDLPKLVYAHSFWIAEGQKMSKSLGNFIDLEKIDSYVETFGLDALRYFLASNGPMGTTDSDFAEAKFIDVYNSDLANTFGNCFSRVSNMCAKYFDGKLPAAGPEIELAFAQLDPTMAKGATMQPNGPWVETRALALTASMNQMDLFDAIGEAMLIIRVVDNYIEKTAPFKLAKDPNNLPQVATILYNCAEALRIASVLLWPVIPHKVEALWQRIGCGHYVDQLSETGRGDFDKWIVWGQLAPGTPIEKGDALFPRHQPAKA
ncbi:methionine--tRNA ligase [Phycisphaerales bacterium AB-hyl4]|uniref:Methionine--tRNA ligase n=1 Tax=Natronomicrosphaera hydrolytica TaxID=3242702 RepID=A0ABV4U1G3_9BACT